MHASKSIFSVSIPGGSDAAAARIVGVIGRIAAHASAWIETCADYRAAASIYERLSRLSDGELRRRGLSRATLGSDIARACDRTQGYRADV